MIVQFKRIHIVLWVCCLLSLSHAATVVDLANKFDNWQCLKREGYSQSIIRGFHSFGAIDTTLAENLRQSNLAGLSSDVYMFPCRGKSASSQVQDLIKYLDSMKPNSKQNDGQQSLKVGESQNASIFAYQSGTIWIDVETNPSSGCSWSLGNPETNCQFLGDLISSLEEKGRSVGIYASAYMWNQIFGSKTACQNFKEYPLWYAHYDGKQTMNDYKENPFGGWTIPTMKQYAGDAPVCGGKVDLSWY